MPKKSSSPATKDDIKTLMQQIGKLYDANEHWKDEIIRHSDNWKDEILQHNERWKNEIIRHFDVSIEAIRHDLLGVNKDRIENHEDRITRLEHHVGTASH